MFDFDADDLLPGSTADAASSDEAEVHSGDGETDDPSESRGVTAVAEAIADGYSLEEIRDALLPSLREEVQGGYRITQSFVDRKIGEILKATREQREFLLTQEELLRQQHGEEDYAAAKHKAQSLLTQQDKELRSQILEEWWQQQAAPAQQAQGQPKPDPNNPVGHWPVVEAQLLDYAEDAGLDAEAVSRLLPKNLQAFVTARDKSGWVGYVKAAQQAIDEEVTRAEKARKPRPRTDSARPAAGGAPTPSSARGYFERAFS